MALAEEKRKILEMISEERISAEEGARLLEALEGPWRQQHRERIVIKTDEGRGGKSLHIRVTDTKSDETQANFTIPLRFARLARSFVPDEVLSRFDLHGIDIDSVLEAIDAGEVGTVATIEDESQHRRVEAWIE